MELLHLEGGATQVPRVEVVMHSTASQPRSGFSLPRQLSPAKLRQTARRNDAYVAVMTELPRAGEAYTA